MRLTVRQAEGAEKTLWITRRQWMNLLYAVKRHVPQAQQTISKPGQNSHPVAGSGEDSGEPVRVRAIRFNQTETGFRITFALAGESREKLMINVQQPGLVNLERMLHQLADRADWDVAAAMVRLDAQQMARAAMNKASGRSV